MPKHKQTSVARNRVKRRLRELTRQTLLPALAGQPPLDVVLRANPDAYAADQPALAAEVHRIVARLTSGRG